jgi:hypothetical protein
VFGDVLEVAIALRRRALGRLAWHGCGARRYDHGRVRVALGDVVVGAALVVRAVSGERGYLARDLLEQRADLGSVVHVAVGQGGRHDLARLGIETDV